MISTVSAVVAGRDRRSSRVVHYAAAFAGLAAIVLVPSYLAWDDARFWLRADAWPLVVLVALAYGGTLGVSARVQGFARVRPTHAALLATTAVFLAVLVVVAVTRFYYSRTFLAAAYPIALAAHLWVRRFLPSPGPTLNVIAGGIATDICAAFGEGVVRLGDLETPPRHGVVVADLHADLGERSNRFLARCALAGVPVLHAAVVHEALTGRVSLAHASDLRFGDRVAHGPYHAIKRVLDVAFVIVASPVLLPLGAIVALAVSFDSKGSVLFWQERVGRNGRSFRMAKFRSMLGEDAEFGPRFATNETSRITRVGAWIRKFRLDELPQFWNVLRGDMSLIGPRPEQTPFVHAFAREIPLYAERHRVRPGISGWAQVHHGYTDGVDGTRVKLEYDLYYVRRLSLWLDVVVAMQSLKAVVTGFGAR